MSSLSDGGRKALELMVRDDAYTLDHISPDWYKQNIRLAYGSTLEYIMVNERALLCALLENYWLTEAFRRREADVSRETSDKE